MTSSRQTKSQRRTALLLLLSLLFLATACCAWSTTIQRRSSSSWRQRRPTASSSSFLHGSSLSRRLLLVGVSSSLQMHMVGSGHSHSHEHGGGGGEDFFMLDNPAAAVVKVWQQQKPLTWTRQKIIRQASLLVASAALVLGPKLLQWLRHRAVVAIQTPDVVAFGFTSLTLSLFGNAILNQFKVALMKLQRLKRGILKHAPKQSMVNNNATAAKDDSILNPIEYMLQATNNDADRVTLIGVVVNLVLSCGKFFMGVTCHSSALIADAGHSLSDLFSDFVTLYSVQLARLPPDDDHPYGHGKFEAIGSLFLALTLLGTGISVGLVAQRELIQILSCSAATVKAGGGALIPKPPALIMALVSILSKEWLYRITKKVGERISSQVVIANAWHHRSDAYSSILALGSIALAIFVPGMVAADAAAGLLVAGMICMTGADILGESIHQLSDSVAEQNQDYWQRLVEQVVQECYPQDARVSIVKIRHTGSSSALLDVGIELHAAALDKLSWSATRAVEEQIKTQILLRQQQERKKGTRSIPMALDVSVKATPPKHVDVVVCPLMMAAAKQQQQEDEHSHSHEHEQASTTTSALLLPSASQVEQCVRQTVLLATAGDTAGVGLQGVTVHYSNPGNAPCQVHVDVDLQQQQQQDSLSSLAQLQQVAATVKSAIETSASCTIHQANIYLDLAATTAAATVVPATDNQRRATPQAQVLSP